MRFLRAVFGHVYGLMFAALTAGAPGAQQLDFADQEEADWNQALAEGSAAAFQRYLEQHPAGRHAEEAFACSVDGALCGGGEFTPTLRQIGPVDLY